MWELWGHPAGKSPCPSELPSISKQNGHPWMPKAYVIRGKGVVFVVEDDSRGTPFVAATRDEVAPPLGINVDPEPREPGSGDCKQVGGELAICWSVHARDAVQRQGVDTCVRDPHVLVVVHHGL